MKVRLAILVLFITLGFGRLVARAHELQVQKHQDLRAEAESQYLRDVQVQPRRGTIYDRHHNALAVTVDVPSLLANPRELRRRHVDVESLAARLSSAISMPVAELRERLDSNSAYRWLKHYLSDSEATAVRDIMRSLRLREGEGIDLPNEPRRWYPNRELAAHVLGFVGSDGHGLEGIERAMDEQLRGRAVALRGVRDAMGRLVFAEGLTPADGQGGNDLTLTIDQTIQFIAERELALTCQEFEAHGGSVVVTDPHTGEILALASYPTYNPNEFGASDAEARRNRAIADRFEPGSTLKIFTVGGALDAGVINAGQLINCYGGSWTIGDLNIHDAHPETWLTPMGVLAHSSNIGAAQIGLALGSDGLERVLRRFGFGERTGIPLPGEARARFGERRWYDVETATVSFGQGIGVTALQLAQALGGVANNGRLVSPLLLSRITDATGALVEEHTPDPGRPAIDPRVARLLADMLTTVTEQGGTGVEAAIPGVRVAGKTGTAQKANEHGRGYDDDRWTSSFIGFAPADRPMVLVTVVIDEPRIAHQGGTVSAPLFRRVTEQTLRYLGRLPAQASAAPPPQQQAVHADRDATMERTAGSISRAAQGERHARSESTTTPDVVGMSARRAVQALDAAGLGAVMNGSGTVTRQTPAAGEPLPLDGRVTVDLEPGGGAPEPRTAATSNEAADRSAAE
jgi:cell division protein FtsI (penicillin-binding protein 3)